MKKKKSYGYKVCYRDHRRRRYVRHFLTYTYRQARSAKEGYKRFPPQSRKGNKTLTHAKWKIIPVNHKDVKSGIWNQKPF